ncbi:D-alanyl-D-alanine carboxypeptidase family protein [Candidatus Parcubacteria bacterium]|nr:MAG: D-alanyl-D-alanine carboxypeptidase family protein [Candidatus Parcubacteria bacterium]
MKKSLLDKIKPHWLVFIFGIVAMGYLIFQHYQLTQYSLNLERDLSKTKESLGSTTQELQNTIIDRDVLAQKLQQEQSRVDTLAAQVEYISGTLGLLEKIQGTDEELLQKYSRVYFLNENYTPKNLTQIDKKYIYNQGRDYYFHTNVLPSLKNLIDNASSSGVDIKILSAYRSFGEQAGLKSNYTVIYGSGANQFSADQGYSEHQLGTTVDFTDSKIGANLAGFEKTKTYEWLLQNAYKYGFVLSYPPGNTYYRFEPWHWRYVGKKLAERLQNEGKYFYDLDQREIDTYLASFFD